MMTTAAMLAVVMTACSSDEEKDTNNRIDLSFRLLNENGEETTTFKKGENIIFDLKIANNCRDHGVGSTDHLSRQMR